MNRSRTKRFRLLRRLAKKPMLSMIRWRSGLARRCRGSRAISIGCDLNLKRPQQKEHQRDLFFAKTVSIFEPLKLMPVNLKRQPHRVVSSAYRQDKIAVL